MPVMTPAHLETHTDKQFAQTGANVPAFTNTQILGHTKTNTIGHTQIHTHKRKAFTNPQTLGHTLTQNKCICNLSM